jgi:hypothetical protein
MTIQLLFGVYLKDNLALFSNRWLSWFNRHKLDRAIWRYLDRSRRTSLFGSAEGAGDIGLGHAGRATRHFRSSPPARRGRS